MAEIESSLWKPLWTVERAEDSNGVLNDARVTKGRASDALLYVRCLKDLRSPAVYVAFDFEGPTATSWRTPPALVAEGAAERAKDAEDSIDQIFISRRNFGEAGRWIKSGWKHYWNKEGYMVLKQEPAAAFIDQLTEVEELAVLVTHDYGEDTSAVFSVPFLRAALESDDVGWEC